MIWGKNIKSFLDGQRGRAEIISLRDFKWFSTFRVWHWKGEREASPSTNGSQEPQKSFLKCGGSWSDINLWKINTRWVPSSVGETHCWFILVTAPSTSMKQYRVLLEKKWVGLFQCVHLTCHSPYVGHMHLIELPAVLPEPQLVQGLLKGKMKYCIWVLATAVHSRQLNQSSLS